MIWVEKQFQRQSHYSTQRLFADTSSLTTNFYTFFSILPFQLYVYVPLPLSNKLPRCHFNISLFLFSPHSIDCFTKFCQFYFLNPWNSPTCLPSTTSQFLIVLPACPPPFHSRYSQRENGSNAWICPCHLHSPLLSGSNSLSLAQGTKGLSQSGPSDLCSLTSFPSSKALTQAPPLPWALACAGASARGTPAPIPRVPEQSLLLKTLL